MIWKWFVQKDDAIHGPFTTDDVQNRLEAGQLAGTNLIWGPGLDQWQSLQTWARELPNLSAVVAPLPEITTESWHYAVSGQSYGPMSRSRLLDSLKRLPSVGDVMVWKKGMKEWVPLYEFHDLLTDVGVNKRQFPRADLDGKVVLKGNGATLVARLLSVSEGGVGVELSESGLVPGEALTMELHSPSFREVINAKVEVRYVGEGYVGLKFTQITFEAKGAVIQFIKQMRIALNAA
jgi:hypothetical protein